MRATYAITSSGRQVATLKAWSSAEAIIEYLRGRGFGDNDIVRLGTATASWRGAVFTATKVDADEPGLQISAPQPA